jgi:hypothetical protein
MVLVGSVTVDNSSILWVNQERVQQVFDPTVLACSRC